MNKPSTRTGDFLNKFEHEGATSERPGLFIRCLDVTTRWLKTYYECCQESGSYR